MKKLKLRLALLYAGSFLVSILPLALTLFFKRNEYMTTVAETVKLSAGLIMGAVFLLLKVVGKLRLPRRITLYAVVTVMAYLLRPLLYDLVLIGSMALIGEVCDSVFFGIAIKKTKESIVTEASATCTADKVEDIIKKYVGGTP